MLFYKGKLVFLRKTINITLLILVIFLIFKQFNKRINMMHVLRV